MISAPLNSISKALRREEVSALQRDEMFVLLSKHFVGVSREQFEHDLVEKSHVIFIRQNDQLAGFSTLHAYESMFEGQVISVIYSGDTIVDPEAWGSNALARAWIDTVNRLRAEFPRGPYYWLLLTSGFRTYRFLPVFWREFHPRFDAAMPSYQQRLREHLACERFGPLYDKTVGVVRFSQPQQLRAGLREIPASRTADPHVTFFEKQNPGHAVGDELVCLTELCAQNLTPAGRRMVEHPPA